MPTRLRTARARLRDIVDPIDLSERVPLTSAAGRVLADPVTTRRPVPHDVGGDTRETTGSVVERDQIVLPAGHRLSRSDLGRCKTVSQTRVAVVTRPTVGVIPTGDHLVDADPESGEIVEPTGLTVASLVERWGGKPTYRDVVREDPEALRAAIQRDLTRDIVVATVDEQTPLPDVVDSLGEVLVDDVSISPGSPACLGRVHETTIILVPGTAVYCLVAAMQLVRPAVKRSGRLPFESFPSRELHLASPLKSEPGTRTFHPVSIAQDEGRSVPDEHAVESHEDVVAEPISLDEQTGISRDATPDGWITVDESTEEVRAGDRVTVEEWEYQP